MIRLAIAIAFAALLMPSSAALAADAEQLAAQKTNESKTVEAKTSAEAPAPRAAKRRLTTAERWRGKPYLSSEDSLMRAQALNKALPPSSADLSRGAFGLYSVEDEELRKRAMDQAIPTPGNQLLVGGF